TTRHLPPLLTPFFLTIRPSLPSTLFPSATLFRSFPLAPREVGGRVLVVALLDEAADLDGMPGPGLREGDREDLARACRRGPQPQIGRAHDRTPVTWPSRMPSSALKKKK